MNELKLFLEGFIARITAKFEAEVANLKAAFEADKNKLIADFTQTENELKAKIEQLCTYPDKVVEPIIEASTLKSTPLINPTETATFNVNSTGTDLVAPLEVAIPSETGETTTGTPLVMEPSNKSITNGNAANNGITIPQFPESTTT